MAENVNPLVLPVKVDATQVTTGVQAVKNRLRELQSYSWSASQSIAQTGHASIVASQEMGVLANQAIQTGNALYQAGMAASRARITMTSLSLVAQDLPFGFIAIQNNLPILIQQFALLRAETGSNLNAFKELGRSMLGPSGLFFGFSVITAAITFAVRKYGSLGMAIKTLFGNVTELDYIQKRATESLNSYNKELLTNAEITGNATAKASDQILQVETLAKAIKNVTLSEKQRKNAIEEIQKLDPKTLENLSLQTKNFQDLDNWVQKYTESLIASAVAQEYLSKVVGTTTQINQQTNLLAELGKGFSDILKRRRQAEQAPEYDPATGADVTAFKISLIATEEAKLTKEFDKQTKVVNDLWKQLDTYKKSAEDATVESLKFFKTTKDGSDDAKKAFQLSIQPQDLEEAYNIDTIIQSLTKYGNILLDTSKNELERKEAIKSLIDINPTYFKGLSTEKSGLSNVKDRIEELIRDYQILRREREFAARSSRLNAELFKNELKGLGEKVDLSDKYNLVPEVKPLKFEDLVESTFELDKLSKPVKALRDFQTELDITGAILNYKTNIESLGEVYKFTFSELVEKNKDLSSSIQSFLYQPLENLFDVLLEKGKKSWKEFGNAILGTLKRIAAQIAATFIAKGIANLLAPGLGQISTSALGAFLGQDFNDITGGFSFNDIRPGGMQMSGQVVFVQRGSDLVGVLNRTNGTINRVG